MSNVVTSTAAHWPSGATEGGPTRLTFHKSSTVSGRFAVEGGAAGTPGRERARRARTARPWFQRCQQEADMRGPFSVNIFQDTHPTGCGVLSGKIPLPQLPAWIEGEANQAFTYN